MYKKLLIVFLLSSVLWSCAVSQPTAAPTEVLKTFIQASKQKDSAKIKEVLSKDSWQLMEKTAQTQGLSVEESIMQNTRGGLMEKMMSEFGEEKINGNEAVVKIKNSMNGQWGEAYLVKEDNQWKVDIAKPLKKMQEAVR